MPSHPAHKYPFVGEYDNYHKSVVVTTFYIEYISIVTHVVG